MSLASDSPLILTLALDAASQSLFDELRQQHFPPERNYLQAHVTLFHHLPGSEQAAIEAHLTQVAATTSPLPLQVDAVRFLGRGVAYNLSNQELRELHRQLQTTWDAWLTPQDRQPLRPHITVQNKVDPAVARALYTELSAGFEPRQALGTGLTLWAYKGGPWEQLRQFSFAG